MNQKIFLEEGPYIELLPKRIMFYDAEGHYLDDVGANSGLAKVILKLVQASGRCVKYNTLYSAYQKLNGKEPKNGIPQALSNLLNGLPPIIRGKIDNHTGEGYSIRLASESVVFHRTEGEPLDLVGDYYGFYLDPNIRDEQGQLLEAYLHIYQDINKDSKMAASAILRIRSMDVLTKIVNEFAGKNDFTTYFETFCSNLDSSNRDCYIAHGEVKDCGKHIYSISLQKKTGHNETTGHWNIILNLQQYMLDDRPREESDDLYRGGLGMMLGGWTTWGVISHQVAIVRIAKSKDILKSLQTEEIACYLRNTNHIRVSVESDKAFYNNWISVRWPEKPNPTP